jgi:aspartate carbamoyltransferase catalytic subunit
MKHILASEQFDAGQLETVFDRADEFRETQRRIHDRREVMKLHEGRIMLSTFYEPSTRTRISFEVAAWKLGFKISGTENASEFSSAAKGESIEDTIKVFNEYGVDAISLRTKEDGYANRAAAVSDVAILNGGDGIGEHPTQAVLDMYTIQNNFEQLSNLNVVIGGDLAHGRTARSLALLLSKYPGNRISFVSTPELQIGRDIKAKLHEDGTRFSETGEMYDALRTANVVYWTRLQKERLKPAPEAGWCHRQRQKKLKRCQKIGQVLTKRILFLILRHSM